jgi:hypothetical protein
MHLKMLRIVPYQSKATPTKDLSDEELSKTSHSNTDLCSECSKSSGMVIMAIYN